MPTYQNNGTSSVSVKASSGVTVFVSPGQMVETYKILSSPFTKISEAPYFPLVSVYEANFTSPGTKTGLLSCKIIRLTAGADGISVKANHADNPYPLELIDGTALDIENNGEIESLIFYGSGSVKIEGF